MRPDPANLTSSPVTGRPISIRWISLVPAKMVKILEGMGRIIGISRSPADGGTAALSDATYRFPAAPRHYPLRVLAALRQPTVWWTGSILTKCVRCWPRNPCGTSPSSAFSTVHRISLSALRRSCARSSRSALMLIADTGPLVAMLNAKDRHHEACTALFRRFRGPIIAPAPIVTEVAYFLQIEPGPVVEAAFLDALASGELIVEATTAQDFARMADLVRQDADFHCAAFELLPAL